MPAAAVPSLAAFVKPIKTRGAAPFSAVVTPPSTPVPRPPPVVARIRAGPVLAAKTDAFQSAPRVLTRLDGAIVVGAVQVAPVVRAAVMGRTVRAEPQVQAVGLDGLLHT